ncbi:MAG TPA: hypothetical protein VMV78_13180 [Thiobacillus sp.]|nr:hypothetical protein [Thiobacillus sp.]
MALFDTIGSECSKAELAACRAIGVIMGFQHRSELPVPIRCDIAEHSAGAEEVNSRRLAEVNEIRMFVPAQSPAFSGVSGFSGAYAITASTTSNKTAAITAGDRFEYPLASGRYYWAKNDGIKPTDNGHTYEVTIREERGLTLGQRS